MAFWLARQHSGQDSDFIQRFDPRFWTVNFPRPVMASVISTGPDRLRVDCEFHHKGELVGLIWDSEDTLDHPLLAYRTVRDYAHCVLRFRWRSERIATLDQPNGPTLTIEGRDAQGNPRTWFVRLWNYATGTPTDAAIDLRFSDLQAGWALPGEPVWPHDIDRMFISIVPADFVAGSTDPLTARVTGYAQLLDMVCEGTNAVIEAGDVVLPPHGERIATAYDDAYNQTPARLLRNVQALGYRDEILHYVGMSHFFRLRREPDGRMLVAQPAVLCTPAQRWHREFFKQCRLHGYTAITSLSYELFAEHCPDAWQQRAHDGSPARTGWVPPSALLSPASAPAMAWLHQVAAQFVTAMKQESLPVRFQIGEPWWWVTPTTGAPCIYDDAARAALGGNPAVITDMRQPLGAAQTAVLDAAGVLLAQSTAGLTQAVRTAAGGPSELLLLAFAPTILDPAMPELKRANLPPGWAFPAFDRLQLEDYDWLTDGAEARRRQALAEVDQRLGYPITLQDYLSGFVLLPEDADLYWRRIDAGLDQAAARGVTRRFVWALPQIARDGYTRLPPPSEDPMQAFDDVLYPLALGRDASATPEFSTTVSVTASGHERRNTLWSDARMSYDVGPGIRSDSELAVLLQFFRARRGAARAFRLTDPYDFSSRGMTGLPSATDQLIGTGDGLNATFPLVKRYGEGPDAQVRRITRPRPDTVSVSIGGDPASGWTLEPGGVIIFLDAPPVGAEIRAGFLFDVPVRFAEDRLDISGAAFAAGEAPSVPLIEVREATA